MTSTAPSDKLASLSMADPTQAGTSSSPPSSFKPATTHNSGQQKKEKKVKAKPDPNVDKASGGKKPPGPKPNPSTSTKLRGMEKDSLEVRISKTFSWLLRHGAQGEGLPMRKDGYVKVADLLNHPKLKAQALGLEAVKELVKADSKHRYDLILENLQGIKLESFSALTNTATAANNTDVVIEAPGTATLPQNATQDGIWWIKARQGHSIKTVQLVLRPITSTSDIPTGIAVHGTNAVAWELISKQGLSKMNRNHIHLAQNVAGGGVVSGMRSSSKVLVYIDVQKALDAGIKFWLSDNGVVLTEGDEKGFLSQRFFERVVNSNGVEIKGWEEETKLPN